MTDNVRMMSWKTCARFPNYEVSEFGDVRMFPSHRRLRGYIDVDGYVRYSMRDSANKSKSIAAHQLVAISFIGPPPSDSHEVAHCDGSRLHNHFSNLRWALSIENHADRKVHRTNAAGVRNGRAKITERDVMLIREEYREIKRPGSGRKVEELDKKYGLHRATIVSIATGKSWTHIPVRPSSLRAA